MSRTKQAVIHGFTFAGSQEIAVDGQEICLVCGGKFTPPGVCIHLEVTYGKRVLADSDGYGICASCVLAGPKTVAERARINAMRLRNKARRQKDEYRRETENDNAEDLDFIVQAFERLKDFSEVPHHSMAVKIAEACLELENPRGSKTGKAA